MESTLKRQERIRNEAESAGRYFRYMAEFVGFTPAHAEAIRESRYVIEKHLPDIVASFYAQLLRYPPTRKFFLDADGEVDEDHLQLRMHHLTNFWRRTASGVYDDDYARFVDYVGRAHTAQGSDPGIYISERYVIGQVGYIQHAITRALEKELGPVDPEWERRAVKAWNLLMMVILEMLARAYGHERGTEAGHAPGKVDQEAVHRLAIETYELALGMRTAGEPEELIVGSEADIPEGERKIVQAGGRSIGVFRHQGRWIAVENRCLHRGGPVATGLLDGDILTCPWHGYQYDLNSGTLLNDPSARLEMYPVTIVDGQVCLQIPVVYREEIQVTVADEVPPRPAGPDLAENEFLLSSLLAAGVGRISVEGTAVAVYHLNGHYYATQDACTHAGGPLSQGRLQGETVICPWHGSCFDVTSGAVTCGPAAEPVRTYRVTVNGDLGRVEPDQSG